MQTLKQISNSRLARRLLFCIHTSNKQTSATPAPKVEVMADIACQAQSLPQNAQTPGDFCDTMFFQPVHKPIHETTILRSIMQACLHCVFHCLIRARPFSPGESPGQCQQIFPAMTRELADACCNDWGACALRSSTRMLSCQTCSTLSASWSHASSSFWRQHLIQLPLLPQAAGMAFSSSHS